MATLTEKQHFTTEILKSRRSIRLWIAEAELTHHDILPIAERIMGIAKSMESDYEKNQEEMAKKREDVKRFREILSEAGLTVDDLRDTRLEKKATSSKRRSQSVHIIEYENADGEKVRVERTITGRTKGDLKDYLDRTGKKLKDCIVEG